MSRVSGGSPAERIRRFAIADAAATFAGTALSIGVYTFAVASSYMVGLAGLLAVTGVLMLSALQPLRNSDQTGALMRLAIANWAISVAVSAVATFVWPVMVLAALLPAVLAPTFVPRWQLRRFIVPSLVLCVVNVVFGLTQDFSGISTESPTWLNNLVLVVSVPVMGALIALIGVQHNLQVGSALDEALAARQSWRNKLPNSAVPGRVWSRPPTGSADASSAICTTVPSNASSGSGCSCAGRPTSSSIDWLMNHPPRIRPPLSRFGSRSTRCSLNCNERWTNCGRSDRGSSLPSSPSTG